MRRFIASAVLAALTLATASSPALAENPVGRGMTTSIVCPAPAAWLPWVQGLVTITVARGRSWT